MTWVTRLDARRAARMLGEPVTSARPVRRGYTPAARWLVRLASGRSAFAKVGTTAQTAEALRLERDALARLTGAFLPAVLAWDDHPDHPMLVLEDLGEAEWPPPWSSSRVARVLEALASLRTQGAALIPIAEAHAGLDNGWHAVDADPAPFLSLGLATSAWLERHLDALLTAGDSARLDGEDALHFDVRSDNMCFTTRGAVLVDWNGACRGNGRVDIAFWLPSLEAEGGPRPESVLPGEPGLAAFVAGYFAARAGLPPIPNAPRVRDVQRQQLGPALAWAIRSLGLESP